MNAEYVEAQESLKVNVIVSTVLKIVQVTATVPPLLTSVESVTELVWDMTTVIVKDMFQIALESVEVYLTLMNVVIVVIHHQECQQVIVIALVT